MRGLMMMAAMTASLITDKCSSKRTHIQQIHIYVFVSVDKKKIKYKINNSHIHIQIHTHIDMYTYLHTNCLKVLAEFKWRPCSGLAGNYLL